MMLLALDVGTKRIGVAIADSELGIALPRPHIVRDAKSYEAIVALISDMRIERIVVGRPTHLSGRRSENEHNVDAFIVTLAKRSGLPIVSFDERLTTAVARDNLRESGLSEKQQKPYIDSEAARILLANYLETLEVI